MNGKNPLPESLELIRTALASFSFLGAHQRVNFDSFYHPSESGDELGEVFPKVGELGWDGEELSPEESGLDAAPPSPKGLVAIQGSRHGRLTLSKVLVAETPNYFANKPSSTGQGLVQKSLVAKDNSPIALSPGTCCTP